MKITEGVLRKVIREELEEMHLRGATLVWDEVQGKYVPSGVADFGQGDELARAGMAAREKARAAGPLEPSQAELEAMDDEDLPLDESDGTQGEPLVVRQLPRVIPSSIKNRLIHLAAGEQFVIMGDNAYASRSDQFGIRSAGETQVGSDKVNIQLGILSPNGKKWLRTPRGFISMVPRSFAEGCPTVATLDAGLVPQPDISRFSGPTDDGM